MKRFIKKILPLVIIYTIILIVFFHGLFNYFLQDDFFNIYRGWIGSFTPTPYLAFRPIPYELFGSLVVYILGKNPILSHAVLFIFHFFNIYLLWLLLGKFTKNKWMQFFASFLYGVSSVHFGVLYWVTANYLLLGTTFLLLFLHALFSYKTNSTKGKLLLLMFLYFCMLFTNESFSLLPVFLFFLSMYEKSIKKLLLPTALFSVLSIAFRLFFKAYSAGPDYVLGSMGEIIKTFWWYVLRSFNLAEGIRLMEKTDLQLVFLCLTGLVICMGLVLLIFFKARKKPDKKILLSGMMWFFLFGFPYFFLVHHATAYYLNTALIGFVIIITFVWLPIFAQTQKRYKLLIVIFLSVWGLLSFLNVKFLQKTSWIVWRGEVARNYITLVKKLYPTLPQRATLVFQNTSVAHKEISLALYEDKAFKLIYNDPRLLTNYDDSYILKPGDFVISDINAN